MKIICSKESLLKVLNIAESVISTKNSISILSNILMEANNNILKISASETKLSFYAEINADIIESGSISVYCNRIYNLLRKLHCDEVEIKTDINNILTINPKDDELKIYSFKGIDPEKFPPIKKLETSNLISISQKIFTEMVRKTIFAVPQIDNRKFVSGILFEKDDNCIRMVSTDGKRLAIIKKDIILENIQNISIIIPPKILTEVMKLCTGNGNINMSFDNKSIFINIDNFYFFSNLLEASFPPYQKVIPANYPNYFVINKKEFYESLDRISLLGDKDSNKVIISLLNNKLKIYSENIAFGYGKEIINIDYNGESIEFALNLPFIIEVLNVLDKDNVYVDFKDKNSTIVIREENNNDYLYIMMPMTI